MPGVIGRQAELLRRAPSFTLLWLATLGSGLGTGIATIALTVDIWDRTGSGKWVSVLLLVEFVPMLAIGLLLGPVVDRVSRRGLMIASDLVRAAVFALLPFAGEPIAIVALAAVAGFATGFFRPAVYAGMPNLVDDADLPQANALFQTIENLTWMLGPLIGGVILSVTSPDVSYVANAVTFLVSAAADQGPSLGNAQLFIDLTKAGAVAEIHVYQRGRHGFGSGVGSPEFEDWMPRLHHFLEIGGFLSAGS